FRVTPSGSSTTAFFACEAALREGSTRPASSPSISNLSPEAVSARLVVSLVWVPGAKPRLSQPVREGLDAKRLADAPDQAATSSPKSSVPEQVEGSLRYARQAFD